MTNVPKRNNQNDEGANGDADAGGTGGDNQQGQNDPNTNAHNYDAQTSKNLLLNIGKRSKCSSRKCSKH